MRAYRNVCFETVLVLTVAGIVGANLSRSHSNVSCETAEECHESLGNRSNCIHGMCQCVVRHHIGDDKACIQDVGLHEPCDRDDQCYWGPEMHDKIRCDGAVCACSPGYLESSGRICVRYFVGAASKSTFSLMLFATSLLGCIATVYVFK